MTEAPRSFDDVCKKAATAFLQTVVVIDNEASLRADEDEQRKVKRSVATRKRSSAPGKEESSPQGCGKEEEAGGCSGSDAPEPDNGESELRAHRLELNQVSRAFADVELTCGVYLPSDSDPAEVDKLVTETVRAIGPTDACVLDWQLRNNDSKPAIDAIKEVLADDDSKGGRLRLILVYTAENLAAASSELEQELRDAGRTVTLGHRDEVPLLTGDHFRIAFANKPTGKVNFEDPGVVEWRELPERIIREFTALSSGLLRAFALESVAAVRRDMHRILTQFDAELDPVYAGDRATKPDPDDAGRLTAEILQSEIMLSVEAENAEKKILGSEGCIAWLASQTPSLDDRRDVKIAWKGDRPDDELINDDVRTKLLQEGAKNASSINRKHVTSSFFGKEQEAEWANRSADYAVLATLAYHSGKRAGRPISSAPLLKFGTIIRSDEKTLLCLQPACDAVRLEKAMPFLFITLNPKDGEFDLVLPQGEAHARFKIPLGSGYKYLRELHTIKFAPADGSDVISAKAIKDASFVFTDDQGEHWEWCAQLRDMTAVHIAQSTVNAISRIGVNEFEWLRTNAKK